MSERSFVLTLGECPRSVNRLGARGQHQAVHGEKKRWEGRFLAELMVAKVPRHMTHATAAITVRWRRRNHRDIENYRHPIVKPLADALVQGGYLPDDTEDYFDVAGLAFEYPLTWHTADPRSKVQLVIAITATYPELA